MSATAFISCAADCVNLAAELAKVLKDEGIGSWAAFQDLQPGQRVVNEIERAAREAQWLVVLVSPKSRSSAWQEAEWSAILSNAWADSDKRVLPVIVGSSQAPTFLRSWVPLRIDPEAGQSSWTQKVLDILRSPVGESVGDLPPDAKREREERFDEMRKTVEDLRRNEADAASIHRGG